MNHRIWHIILLLLFVNLAQAQPKKKFMGGLKPMKQRDFGLSDKLAVTDEENAKLPRSVSYEAFCPTAGNQGEKATTVAYATAYYLRTILENQALNSKESEAVNANRLSPDYLYQRCKSTDDTDCKNGISLESALGMLRTEGVPRLQTAGPMGCNQSASNTAIREAANYRIADYKPLFGAKDSKLNKLRLLRKTLAEGTPVVIEFMAPESFTLAKKAWTRVVNETVETAPYGLALCVIGYDDNQFGGAFRVVNSWGREWGDNGKCWISYADMPTFTTGAFRVMPLSAASRMATVSGQVDIRLTNGQALPMESVVVEGIRTYQPGGTYPAGKEIKLHARADQLAYVYLFGLGSEGVTRYVPTENESAPPIRPGEPFVFPAESQVITLEKALGQDHLLFLFSPTPIADMGAVTRMLQQTAGTPQQKVTALLKSQSVVPIDYGSDTMSFSASGGKGVVPVLIRL